MHDGDFGLHALIGQIQEEGLELHGGQHALVGDGARGQGREVDANLVLHAFADAEGPAIQFDAGELIVRIGHNEGLERRHAGKSLQAESVRVGWHDAPCEYFETLFTHDSGDGLLLLTGGGDVTVEECDAGCIVAFLRQFHTYGGTHELVGHAHEDARAITGILFGADRTTMVQVDKHFDGVVNDLALRSFVEGGDHTHAAGVVLGAGIIHTLGIMDRQI